jgi:hypothetical protein
MLAIAVIIGALATSGASGEVSLATQARVPLVQPDHEVLVDEEGNLYEVATSLTTEVQLVAGLRKSFPETSFCIEWADPKAEVRLAASYESDAWLVDVLNNIASDNKGKFAWREAATCIVLSFGDSSKQDGDYPLSQSHHWEIKSTTLGDALRQIEETHNRRDGTQPILSSISCLDIDEGTPVVFSCSGSQSLRDVILRLLGSATERRLQYGVVPKHFEGTSYLKLYLESSECRDEFLSGEELNEARERRDTDLSRLRHYLAPGTRE